MPKKTVRQSMLARRRILAASEVKSASLMVQSRFIASDEFARADVLALYAPIHNEVDTAAVFAAARSSAKTVLYPTVSGTGIEFRPVIDLEELRKGAFGIPEPPESRELYNPLDIDLIVIPGVAFDLAGKRVGYGKGYYDKTLHFVEGRKKLVGFCYEFQLVEEIKDEPHDVRMDLLVTEKRVMRPRN